jgi:hypothetical protein
MGSSGERSNITVLDAVFNAKWLSPHRLTDINRKEDFASQPYNFVILATANSQTKIQCQ